MSQFKVLIFIGPLRFELRTKKIAICLKSIVLFLLWGEPLFVKIN